MGPYTKREFHLVFHKTPRTHKLVMPAPCCHTFDEIADDTINGIAFDVLIAQAGYSMYSVDGKSL